MSNHGGLRFLFTCLPAYGHLHAMMPYAVALKQHGHQVVFVTGEKFGPTIHSSGLGFLDCGISDADLARVLDVKALPEYAAIRARLKGAPLGVVQMHAFIESVTPLMWPTLERVMVSWLPDVIVRAPLEFAGFFAAEKARIPHATVDWATHIPAHLFAGSALKALASRFGLSDVVAQSFSVSPLSFLASRVGFGWLVKDPIILDRHLVLSAMPPSWRYTLVPRPEVLFRYAVPPFDHNAPQPLPQWISDMPDLPLVYATLGTAFNKSTATVAAIISALGAEPVNGIVTVGPDHDPAEFEPLPGNVRVERYIPQSLLLDRCSAVVFHGGFNTLHGALWHGVPMVIMPQGGGDQSYNAKQAVARGVGVIPKKPFDTKSIRSALRMVLSQGRFRARAKELQSAMMSLPPLSDAVSRLERLTSRDR